MGARSHVARWGSSLAEMMARATPDNLHPEVDTGPPAGN